MPGTIDQWPNWSIALPVPLEVLEQSPLAARLAAALGRGAAPPEPAGPPDAAAAPLIDGAGPAGAVAGASVRD